MKQWIALGRAKKLWRRIQEFRHKAASNLLTHVMPADLPYFLDAKLSFMQRSGESLTHPIVLDIFIPDIPLAIDLFGPGHSGIYSEAKEYMDRTTWEQLQADLAHKRQVLARYSIPYLVITSEEAIDPASLRERIRTLTGINLS